MQNLYANIITEMYGPYFLAVYLVFILLVLAGVWFALRLGGRVRITKGPDKLPVDPDPYDIAVMRDERDVIMLGIMRLLEMGALRCNSTGGMLMATGKVPARMNRFEVALLQFFSQNRLSRLTLNSEGLKSLVKKCFGSLKEKHRRDGLVSSMPKAVSYAIRITGALLIGGFGFYKMNAAVTAGHRNVLFLFVMGLLGMATSMAVQGSSLTNGGRRYLRSLRTAYGSLPASRVAPLALEQASLAAAVAGFRIFSTEEWEHIRKIYSFHSMRGPSSGGGYGIVAVGIGGGGCGGGVGGCGG